MFFTLKVNGSNCLGQVNWCSESGHGVMAHEVMLHEPSRDVARSCDLCIDQSEACRISS